MDTLLGRYYNLDGSQIQSIEELAECQKNKVIKQEEIANGEFISTVWIGLDMSYNSDKKLIFETMAFKSKDDFTDLDCYRYETLDKAIEGHERMVKSRLNS